PCGALVKEGEIGDGGGMEALNPLKVPRREGRLRGRRDLRQGFLPSKRAPLGKCSQNEQSNLLY
ncbi:unnamed protein product, partial [Musa textilis]